MDVYSLHCEYRPLCIIIFGFFPHFDTMCPIWARKTCIGSHASSSMQVSSQFSARIEMFRHAVKALRPVVQQVKPANLAVASRAFAQSAETDFSFTKIGQDSLEVHYERPIHSLQVTEMMNAVHEFSTSVEAPSELRLSTSLDDAKFQNRRFYRKVIRLIPRLLLQYDMYEIPPSQAIRSLRSHFKKHHGIEDVAVLDKLRWHGEVVLADLVRLYFTHSHVQQLVNPNVNTLPDLPTKEKSSESPFLADFFANESAVAHQLHDYKDFEQPDRY